MTYLALGANTGPRADTLRRAVALLETHLGTAVALSAFYDTAPVGFSSPHRFLNAAVAFDTDIDPHSLLSLTRRIETQLGRTTKSCGTHYTDRPIDIDILLCGPTVVATDSLCLPHPRMTQRRFVLEPLAEIAPDALHPTTGLTISRLLQRLNRATIVRLLPTDDDARLYLRDVTPPDALHPTPPSADATMSTADATKAVNALLPQLSERAALLEPNALGSLVARTATRLYLALDETGQPAAMATLCLATSPTGTKAWVEDVVTDSAARKRGYAARLLQCLRAEAQSAGAKSLNLTSRPQREAANRLYRRMGFRRRETNVYTLPIGPTTTTDA